MTKGSAFTAALFSFALVACGDDSGETTAEQASSGGSSAAGGAASAGKGGAAGGDKAGAAGMVAAGGKASAGAAGNGAGGAMSGGGAGGNEAGGAGGSTVGSGGSAEGGSAGNSAGGSTAGSHAGGASQGGAGQGGAGQGGAPAGVGDLTKQAAASICSALFRCCSSNSVEQYFQGYANNENLAAFADKLPPQAEVTEAGCPALVQQMLDIVPFGSWVEQVEAGRVSFDAAAFAGCTAKLDGAACGEEVTTALFDGTCLGFAAPAGGEDQRKMFKRTAKSGDACASIKDGLGAAFYGTCDPTSDFCCFEDPATPGACGFPKAGEVGTCKAVAPVGEACSVTPTPGQPIDILLCATGTDCVEDKCLAPSTTPLANGDLCFDDVKFVTLGICSDGYCDVFGSKKCEARKADGQSCQGGDECQSGSCNGGSCGEPTFCVSTGAGGAGGAGAGGSAQGGSSSGGSAGEAGAGGSAQAGAGGSAQGGAQGGDADTLADTQGSIEDIALDATDVYWVTIDGAIRKISQQGGSVTELVAKGANLVNGPGAIAVDDQYVYWFGSKKIVRKRKDNSGDQELFNEGEYYPGDLAVDADGVYWTGDFTGKVMSAKKDGTGYQEVFVGEKDPSGIAVSGGTLYWATKGSFGSDYTDGGVVKGNKDGSNRAVLATGLIRGRGVTVVGDNVFATAEGNLPGSYQNGSVWKIPVDGSGATALVAVTERPYGIASDGVNVYWSCFNDASPVSRVSASGGAVVEVAPDQPQPFAVALSATHLFWGTKSGTPQKFDGGFLRRLAK